MIADNKRKKNYESVKYVPEQSMLHEKCSKNRLAETKIETKPKLKYKQKTTSEGGR